MSSDSLFSDSNNTRNHSINAHNRKPPIQQHKMPGFSTQPRKRHASEHLPTSHESKRRLVDTLSKLSFGQEQFSASPSPQSFGSPSLSSRSPSLNIFESDHLKELDLTTMNDFGMGTANGSKSKDRVIISSIDQFLRENPDDDNTYMSYPPQGEHVTNIDDVQVEKLLIPKIELLKWLGFKDGDIEDNKLHSSVQKIFKEISKKGNTALQVSNSEVLYELYLQKFWSLIKFYDPSSLAYRKFVKWVKKQLIQNDSGSNTNQIQELDDEGDDLMTDTIDYPTYSDATKTENIDVDNNYKNWTSEYGSYYQHLDTNVSMESQGAITANDFEHDEMMIDD